MAAPGTQATSIISTNVTATTLTVDWTRGNGAKVAVFAKMASSGDLDGLLVNTTTYTANTAMGSGTQVGSTGWYCIYNNTGTTVNVTGMVPGATYSFHACEYNGTAGAEEYNDDASTFNPGTASMLAAQLVGGFDDDE